MSTHELPGFIDSYKAAADFTLKRGFPAPEPAKAHLLQS